MDKHVIRVKNGNQKGTETILSNHSVSRKLCVRFLYRFAITHVYMDMTQCSAHVILIHGNVNWEAISHRARLAVCMPVSREMMD